MAKVVKAKNERFQIKGLPWCPRAADGATVFVAETEVGTFLYGYVNAIGKPFWCVQDSEEGGFIGSMDDARLVVERFYRERVKTMLKVAK